MCTIVDTDGQVLTKVTVGDIFIEYHNSRGERHRISGPARIWSDGSQSYWVNGKLHRIDGPAVIDLEGTVAYFVDDIQYTKEQYHKAVIKFKLKQLVG
jgi:hypothetical protein